MANSFLVQTLEEGPKNAIVKLTGVLDTSNLAPTVAIAAASFNQGGTGPVPDQFRIDHIDYTISDPLEILLSWDATSPVIILPLAGRGRLSYWCFAGLQNNAGAGKTGNILISTNGFASGIAVFALTLELVKQGRSL